LTASYRLSNYQSNEQPKIEKLHKVFVEYGQIRFGLDINISIENQVDREVQRWKQTDLGIWATTRTVVPLVVVSEQTVQFKLTRFAIIAKFTDTDYTFWVLKWANQVDIPAGDML
jgi:hypothetical protein